MLIIVSIILFDISYTKDHGETLYSTHVRWFQVTLETELNTKTSHNNRNTYDPDKNLISHIFNRDIVHKTRYNCARTRFFTKVDLLRNLNMINNTLSQSLE